MEKETKGLTVKKDEDISRWYQEVIIKSELVEYSDVSGCMIFRPYCYAIWEFLKDEIDMRFKEVGIQNCYFPLFIPEKHLSREADHVEGFAPEVAWVTHTGNSELAERLAVRPTSETIMYPTYSKWIRSWRDLPLRLNQWNNVVRWEFKNPVPLMRSREFLWNEGHTVFATEEEAKAEGDQILGIYQKVLKDHMAIYGVAGFKSEKENFAGAEYTCSIESFLESGKAIQGPDFHHDGQIFAKAFDITFLDKDEKKQFAYQNTFAFTTRMIGVMIMMHGDDKGLILPPKVAPIQIVIVPIFKESNKQKIVEKAAEIKEILSEFRTHLDDREEYSPGRKFNEYEMKGVPVRLEFGPKDLEAGQVVLVRRDTGEKETLPLAAARERIKGILSEIHLELYKRSKKNFTDSIVQAADIEEMKRAVGKKKMVLAPFCNDPKCEDAIKESITGITTRNSPFDAVAKKGAVCIGCSKKADRLFYFAKAY